MGQYRKRPHINITLDELIYKRALELATKKRRPLSTLIQMALEYYFTQGQPEPETWTNNK